jgi:hypothetical protein
MRRAIKRQQNHQDLSQRSTTRQEAHIRTESTADVIDSPDQSSPNRGTVPTTESNGSAQLRPHNATTPPASGVCSKGHAQRDDNHQRSLTEARHQEHLTPRHQLRRRSGRKATCSETTPRHSSTTGVEEELHGAETHQRAPSFATQPPTPAELR